MSPLEVVTFPVKTTQRVNYKSELVTIPKAGKPGMCIDFEPGSNIDLGSKAIPFLTQ